MVELPREDESEDGLHEAQPGDGDSDGDGKGKGKGKGKQKAKIRRFTAVSEWSADADGRVVACGPRSVCCRGRRYVFFYLFLLTFCFYDLVTFCHFAFFFASRGSQGQLCTR